MLAGLAVNFVMRDRCPDTLRCQEVGNTWASLVVRRGSENILPPQEFRTRGILLVLRFHCGVKLGYNEIDSVRRKFCLSGNVFRRIWPNTPRKGKKNSPRYI